MRWIGLTEWTTSIDWPSEQTKICRPKLDQNRIERPIRSNDTFPSEANKMAFFSFSQNERIELIIWQIICWCYCYYPCYCFWSDSSSRNVGAQLDFAHLTWLNKRSKNVKNGQNQPQKPLQPQILPTFKVRHVFRTLKHLLWIVCAQDKFTVPGGVGVSLKHTWPGKQAPQGSLLMSSMSFDCPRTCCYTSFWLSFP